MNKYYKILGASVTDTDEEIRNKYYALKREYQEKMFEEGESGNKAAKMLSEIEVAYNEIKLENIIKNRNFAEIFTNQ